jgi:hypothetical protein
MYLQPLATSRRNRLADLMCVRTDASIRSLPHKHCPGPVRHSGNFGMKTLMDNDLVTAVVVAGRRDTLGRPL